MRDIPPGGILLQNLPACVTLEREATTGAYAIYRISTTIVAAAYNILMFLDTSKHTSGANDPLVLNPLQIVSDLNRIRCHV
jgi:hypothetical protein